MPNIAAQAPKPIVNPSFHGDPPGTRCAARIAVTIAAPMLAPIERARVLTPVAMPVCSGVTCAMALGRAA